MRRSFRLTGAALCVGTVLAAVGCASAGSATQGQDSQHQVLRLGHQLGVATWDPAKSLGGSETRLLNLVHDRLIHLAPDGTLAPGLARSWTFDATGSQLVLKLRPGLTFSDDSSLTAQSVVTSLDRARLMEGSTLKAGLAGVTAVEAMDATTVRIALNAPDTSFPALLSDRFGMVVKVDGVDAAYQVPTETGTSGMFHLTKNAPGVSFRLTRTPGYWNAGATKLDGVDVTVLKDATARLNALRSGQVDLTVVDADQLDEAKALPSVTVMPTTTFNVVAVWLNGKHVPQFNDPRVRKALSLATDRSALVEGITHGYGEPAAQLYPSRYYAHDTSAVSTRDVETARRLMSEAGVTNLTVPFVVTAPLAKTAEALQAQWQQVGVNLDVRPLAGFGVAEQLWQRKTAAAGMANFTGRSDPAIVFSMFALPGQQTNPGDIVDPNLVRLVAASKAEQDATRRAEIFREIARICAEQPQGFIPLYFPQDGVVFDKKVTGMRPWLDGFPHLEGVSISSR